MADGVWLMESHPTSYAVIVPALTIHNEPSATNMSALAWTYTVYLAASAVIAVTVGRTLFHHGRPFLIDCFGNERAADAVNQMLLVGFYLTNIAFVMLTLRSGLSVIGWRDGSELLSHKLGVVLTTLGVMHFGNLLLLSIARKYKQRLAN